MHWDEQTVAAQLLRLLHLVVEQELPNTRGFSTLNAAVVLVKALEAKTTVSQDLRRKVLYCLSTNEFSEPLQRFSAFTPLSLHVEHDKYGVCPASYAKAQHNLFKELCCFLLQTGLRADDDESSLDGSLVTSLFHKAFDSSHASLKCKLFMLPTSFRNHDQVSLFEAGSTPQELPSRQWRDQLANSLSRNAEYQHQHVVKTMNEVCRDLEARCDNAEQPLREEQARTADLRQKLEEAETRNAELASQDEERGHSLEGLRADAFHLKEEADAANERSKALLADLAVLQQDLERTKKQTARAAEESSEAARHQDLTYMAVIKGKDEECQKRSDRIEILEAQNSESSQRLADNQEQEATRLDQMRHLEESLAKKTHEIEEAHALSRTLTTDIEQLQAVNAQSEAGVAAANVKIEETMAERDDISSKLHAQASSFISERSGLQKRYGDLVVEKADEVDKLHQSHQTTVRKMRKEFEQAEKLAERAAKAKATRIKDLEGKMSVLRRDLGKQTSKHIFPNAQTP